MLRYHLKVDLFPTGGLYPLVWAFSGTLKRSLAVCELDLALMALYVSQRLIRLGRSLKRTAFWLPTVTAHVSVTVYVLLCVNT